MLKSDPGRSQLSKREIEKLTEVTDRYRGLDDSELSELTHTFAEWDRHYQTDTPTPIPWEDMLQAQGKPELIEIAESDEAARRDLDGLFGD